jgi:hypothetical protein
VGEALDALGDQYLRLHTMGALTPAAFGRNNGIRGSQRTPLVRELLAKKILVRVDRRRSAMSGHWKRSHARTGASSAQSRRRSSTTKPPTPGRPRNPRSAALDSGAWQVSHPVTGP